MADEIAAPAATEVAATKVDGGPAEGKQAEQAAAEVERKYKLKFGKQEREVSEKELIALGQKSWASDEQFKTAAQMRKEVKDAIENGDLDDLIKRKYGKSKVDYAKDILKAEIRKAAMSPEERALADKKDELSRLRAEEQEIKTRREQEKMDAAQRHYMDQYDRELSEAVKKHGLPKNKYAVSRAVKIASEVVDMGLDPDWDLVVGEAKKQIQEEIAGLIDEVQDSVGFIGEDRARKISKLLVSRGVTSKEAARVVHQEGKKKEPEILDLNEWADKKAKQWADEK